MVESVGKMSPRRSHFLWGIVVFIGFLSGLLAGAFLGTSAQSTAAGDKLHVQAAQTSEDLQSPQSSQSPERAQDPVYVKSPERAQDPVYVKSPGDVQGPEDVQRSGGIQIQQEVQSPEDVPSAGEAILVTDPPEVSPYVEEHAEHATYRFPFEDGHRVEVPEGSILENARASFAKISEVILDRWGGNSKMFQGGMAFTDGGTVVRDKMLNAVVEQGGFVAAFTGTSVTAGHDCLYEDSYPVRLNSTMGELMASTGVRFESINVAMGNTRTSPYSYCVDAHAGIDADIVSWEMMMEVQSPQCGRAAQAIELFIRSALSLPRRPAVLIMDGSPDQGYCAEHRVKNILAFNTRRMGECKSEPPERALTTVYSDYGLHHISSAALLAQYGCNNTNYSREKLFSEGKCYPHPMSWHPGPGGHQLVADILFMHYAPVFLNALERLELTAAGLTAGQLREKTASEKLELKTSLRLGNMGPLYNSTYMGAGRGDELPQPSWCTGWALCDGAGNFRCANTYDPLAGREGSRLLDMVASGVTIANRAKDGLVTTPLDGSWALSLNEEKRNILKYFEEAQPPDGKLLPIDRKWVLVGDKMSGPIVFEFETRGFEFKAASVEAKGNDDTVEGGSVDNRRLMVCKPDFIDRVELDDPSGIRYKIDGVETQVVDVDRHFGMHEGSCVILEAQIGVGRHSLSVEPLKYGKPYVAMSHIIYPA